MPLGDHPVRIPDQHPAIQYLQQVLVAGLRLAQDCRVEQFHVRVGNILQRDQPLKLSFLIGNTQRIDMPVIHPLPGGAAAHLPVHARLLPDVDVPDVRTHIDREPWRLHAKMIQHKGGFLADLTRAPRLVRLADMHRQSRSRSNPCPDSCARSRGQSAALKYQSYLTLRAAPPAASISPVILVQLYPRAVPPVHGVRIFTHLLR